MQKNWISKAEELLNVIVRDTTKNPLEWSNCRGVCTQGRRFMPGIPGAFQDLIHRQSPCDLWTHCMTHRQALVSKRMSPELEEVLETVINVVNSIKRRPLKAKMFIGLCEEMGPEHTFLTFLP
jgi:hypothetical protein